MQRKSVRPANGIVIDYTWTLRLIVDDMLSEECQVLLDEQQYRILVRYLDRIEALGEHINFRLEMCADFRPNHLVAWDNSGSPEEDRAVDAIMNELIEELGFRTAVSAEEAE